MHRTLLPPETQTVARSSSRVTAILLVLTTLFVLAVVGGSAWFFATMSVHPDPAAVPSTSTPHEARFAEAVAESRRRSMAMVLEQNLPGISVAVGVGDQIVWADGFGLADLETRTQVTPDTRMRIGTASSMLTAAAAGRLIDEGALSLDEPVETYVQRWPVKPWPVTLRHVMGHTAGLRTDRGDESVLFGHRCARPEDALPHFADRDLLFEPATGFRSSNYGAILTSAAIETASGRTFLDFMRAEVFGPLGMHDTDAQSSEEENPDHMGEPGEDPPPFTFVREVILEPLGLADPRPPAPGVPQLTTSYFPRRSAEPRYGQHEMRPLNLSCYAGAMVFYSTASDLARFGLGVNAGRLVRPETVALMQTSQTLESGASTGYGLGWDVDDVTLGGSPARAIGHDGDMLGGRVVTLLTFPDRALAVAVVSNIAYADTRTLALQVAELFSEAGRPAGQARTSGTTGTTGRRSLPLLPPSSAATRDDGRVDRGQ